jgi:hypothetical protein
LEPKVVLNGKPEDVPNANLEKVIQSSLTPCYKKNYWRRAYTMQKIHTHKKNFPIVELPKQNLSILFEERRNKKRKNTTCQLCFGRPLRKASNKSKLVS